MGITLNNEQLFTVMDMENWFRKGTKQTYDISGAAGTGKTTLVVYLIERLGLTLDEVLFVAYMGKAATQLSRNGLPAKTIHSAFYEYRRVPEIDPTTKRRIILPNGRLKMKQEFALKDHIKKRIKLIVIDEAGMVPEGIAKDILSFGVPVIALGDLNQLPPVFGKAYFLKAPDSILTQIMRQKEGDPIIWLSQQVLAGKRLRAGVYQKSSVIRRADLNDYLFQHNDIVLTERNSIRNSVNRYYREYLQGYRTLDRPHIGEKVICRKNNWDLSLGGGIYLTNGMTGTIDDVHMSSFNGRTINIDFLPDFMNRPFRSIPISYHHLFSDPGEDPQNESKGEVYLNKMEFAYAITVHSSQGSQYNRVVYLEDDGNSWGSDIKKRIAYTAITRARESITYVLNS